MAADQALGLEDDDLRPAIASDRATANPTTPAPTTTASTCISVPRRGTGPPTAPSSLAQHLVEHEAELGADLLVAAARVHPGHDVERRAHSGPPNPDAARAQAISRSGRASVSA